MSEGKKFRVQRVNEAIEDRLHTLKLLDDAVGVKWRFKGNYFASKGLLEIPGRSEDGSIESESIVQRAIRNVFLRRQNEILDEAKKLVTQELNAAEMALKARDQDLEEPIPF